MMNKWINRLDDIIATIALAGIISFTSANVILRFVFNNPFAWAEEVSLGLHIWVVFIGISSTMKRDGHVGIDYFVEKLPELPKKIAVMIRRLVIYAVLLYVLIYLGIKYTMQISTITPVLGISGKWIVVAIPIGGAFTLYQYIRGVYRKNALEGGEMKWD